VVENPNNNHFHLCNKNGKKFNIKQVNMIKSG